MPKKRNTCWSRNKKEKQIITARLMEISLKIEDYIYKHKPISVWEAEQYTREVVSYKIQCSQDERSLQVIEKLTRCMRAIILDHQELGTENQIIDNGSSVPADVVREGSISPVYSMIDEDRTQFTQIAEEVNNDVGIIDLTDNNDDDSIRDGTQAPTADYAGSKVTVEVDIHRGISSLSLRDVEEPLDMAMSTDADCSQSILHNFEGIELMQQNVINIIPQREVTGGLVVAVDNVTKNVMKKIDTNSMDKIPNKNPIIELYQPVTTIDTPNKAIIISNTKNNLNYNTVEKNKEPPNCANTTNYEVTNAYNLKDNTIISKKKYPSTNSFPVNQKPAYDTSNKTASISDYNPDDKHLIQPRQMYKDVSRVTVHKAGTLSFNSPRNPSNVAEKEKQAIVPEKLKIPQQNNKPISKTVVFQEDIVTTKKKRGSKKKFTDKKENKPKTKVCRRNPKSNKENIIDSSKNIKIPIYNENVIEDLSWIENIRYVREIGNDENDPKLILEESFWDNYHLPANWSENEYV